MPIAFLIPNAGIFNRVIGFIVAVAGMVVFFVLLGRAVKQNAEKRNMSVNHPWWTKL